MNGEEAHGASSFFNELLMNDEVWKRRGRYLQMFANWWGHQAPQGISTPMVTKTALVKFIDHKLGYKHEEDILR